MCPLLSTHRFLLGVLITTYPPAAGFGDYWNGLALEQDGWGQHLDASCANAAYYAARLPSLHTLEVGAYFLKCSGTCDFLHLGHSAFIFPLPCLAGCLAASTVLLATTSSPLPTFVGEFSLASTDCTIYLSNGINGGCDMASDPGCTYKSGAEALSGMPSCALFVCYCMCAPYGTHFHCKELFTVSLPVTCVRVNYKRRWH